MKTKAKPASEFVTGTCKWCEDKGVRLFRDNRLCEDCDGKIVRCGICKTSEHEDDHCRHVFQSQHGEWCGAGIGIADSVKPALFKLFGLMPEGFAADLKIAIKSRRFHTWMVAPLVGGGGTLSMYGMPDRDGKWMLHAWGDAMIAIGESAHAEDTADGYRWLVSLYDGATLKANRATIAWIDEWQEGRKP